MTGETFLSDEQFLNVMKSEIERAANEFGAGSDECLSEIRLGTVKRLINIAEKAGQGTA